MDSIKSSFAAIPDAEWSKLAELAKTTPEALQQRYQAFVEEHPQHLRTKEVKLGKAEKDNNCIRRDFEISLFKVLGIRGYVQLCGTPENWQARLHICLVLRGDEVWCQDFVLSNLNPHICIEVNLVAVKAKLCFGLRGSQSCFYISGEACYWAFGWHCASFDETIVCLNP